MKEHGGKEERRPYLATECTDLKAAEKWRVQIIREISKKVAQIQNGTRFSFLMIHIAILCYHYSWIGRVQIT